MASAAFPMISIPEAVSIVLSCTPVLEPEEVPFLQAVGCILSSSITARDSLPPFPASIKDGYAVVSSDGVGEFTVIGESRAGCMDDVPLQPKAGSVAYITTGAPVPQGADAVVQIEDTELVSEGGGGRGGGGKKRVKILKAAVKGQDIRSIGSDIMQGATVLEAGERIGVAEIGILATVGAVKVSAFRKPHVGILSTGDEVVEPETDQLGPGQIRDANRSMLMAAAANAGAKVTDLGVARDAEGELMARFKAAIDGGIDVLITSGGVSMGDRDLIQPLLDNLGATIHFGRVRMKPGKPLTFATLDVVVPSPSGSCGSSADNKGQRRMLVFGLPGNPVSSFACFHLVSLPSLRKMMGWPDPNLRRINVRLAQSIKLDPERPEYHRATLQFGKCPSGKVAEDKDEFWAVSTGNQISSRLLSARLANALLELPQASGVLEAGAVVSALLIDDLQLMPT